MFQFSSGSTGTPKKIARTHANLLFELNSLVETLNLSNQDRFIGVAPFSHVNGLMRSMMACVRVGGTLHPVAKFERQAVVRLIEANDISMFIAVPFMFSILAQSNFRPAPDFSSLRLCVSASAPMPKKFNQMFYAKFGIYVRQLYGSTETGTISVNLSPDIETSLESVGTPIAGVEVEVFLEDGRVAAVDEMGEFAVKSPGAIKGYESLPEINREAFREGYFFTGDLGQKDEHGLLSLIGRKKFFINKGGYKIDPRSIEEILEGHPKVEEVVVLGIPTPYGDEKVKAVIVPNTPCTVEEIVEHCQGKIADFKIPSLVEFRDELPKSPTGKIRRGMLME
jgi:long-chain acyl-CoA synthetase